MIFWLCFFRFDVVIDRIESDFAVIEWENLALSVLPLQMIDCPIEEGSRITLFIYPSPYGAIASPPMLLTEYGPVIIPIEGSLHYTTKYGIKTQCPSQT